MVLDDFDAQSEQLSGHRQEYVKLSSGPTRGLPNGVRRLSFRPVRPLPSRFCHAPCLARRGLEPRFDL